MLNYIHKVILRKILSNVWVERVEPLSTAEVDAQNNYRVFLDRDSLPTLMITELEGDTLRAREQQGDNYGTTEVEVSFDELSQGDLKIIHTLGWSQITYSGFSDYLLHGLLIPIPRMQIRWRQIQEALAQYLFKKTGWQQKCAWRF